MYLLLQADQRIKQHLLLLAHLQELYLFFQKYGLILNQELNRISYPVAKRLSTLHRHGHLPREEDEAIEFWRFKDNLQKHFQHCHHWSDDKWKSNMEGTRGNKKIFHIVLNHQDKKFFISEPFKVIQDAIPLIPSLQDNVLIPNNSSSIFITSDVQSVYTPSRILD